MRNNSLFYVLVICAFGEYVLALNIKERNYEAKVIRNRRQTEDDDCLLPEAVGGTFEVNDGDGFKKPGPGYAAEEGTILKIKCSKGFILDGLPISRCTNGIWPDIPKCIRACKSLVSTSIDFSCNLKGKESSCDKQNPVGSIANIKCKSGYISTQQELFNDTITCEGNGEWSFSYFKCKAVCGTVAGTGSKFVIQGTKATIPEFPWHAAIYQKRTNSDPVQICGGSIISSNAVLSAAHCFWDKIESEGRKPELYAVGYGKAFSKWQSKEDPYGKYSDVKKLILHSDYDDAQGNYAQDIAVLILKNIIEFSDIIKPVCVEWSSSRSILEIDPWAMGKVAGWGWTEETGVPSNELMQITIPVVSKSICWDSVPSDFIPNLTIDKFCAGTVDGSSVCHGDSGGGLCFPVIDAEGNSIYYVRGIVSVAPSRKDADACDSWAFTAFTDTANHIRWLKSLNVHEDPNIFKCTNGIIVTGTACDKVTDCEDGSDESEKLCSA